MFEPNAKRTPKTTMIDIISGCDLNFMKVLFDALIREIKANVTFGNCQNVLSIDDQNSNLFRSHCLYLREISMC